MTNKQKSSFTGEIKTIDDLNIVIDRVKTAQEVFSTFSQEQVDKIFTAMALAANNARIPLAKMAVEETGMGIMEDKVIKNHFASEEIYNKYRDYGYQSIPEPEYEIKEFSKELIDYLTDIWATFGIYDGKYLEEQTHKEKPWIIARKGYEPGQRCNEIITKESMKEYFKEVLNEG